MSTLKTKIDSKVVSSFLENYFQTQIGNFQFIKGGESSQAFSFTTKGTDFIIRINTSMRSFEKDKYAFEHFSLPDVPIPRVIEIGKLDDTYVFAISEKVPGKIMNDLIEEEHYKTLPSLLKTLDLIHSIDVSKKVNYGKWNSEGDASSTSWKESILQFKEYVESTNGEPSLFETSFLEKEVWYEIFHFIENLLPYCPEEKYLVHGDYGFDNVLSDGEQITGVIDWAESRYGDFLYDIAWMIFWSGGMDFKEIFEKHYKEKGLVIPNFQERILCYQVIIGLSSIGFYARSEQREKYDSVKARILKLIN